MSKLSLNTLRAANVARLPQFKNKHGQPAHSKPDGSDWNPAQWLRALVGELAEWAELRIAYERGQLTHAQYEEASAKELADVQTYLDILALRSLDTVNQLDGGVLKTNEELFMQLVVNLGSYAEAAKKFDRMDIDVNDFTTKRNKHLDTALSTLTALHGSSPTRPPRRVIGVTREGVDLAHATTCKFNEVSERVSSEVFITGDDNVAYLVPRNNNKGQA